MVRITSFIGAIALFSTAVSALPARPIARTNHESSYGQAMPQKEETSVSAAHASTSVAAQHQSTSVAHQSSSASAAHSTSMVEHKTSSAAHQQVTSAAHSTSSAAAHSSSSSAAHQITTAAPAHTTTSSAASHTSSALPQHGSGSSDWGNKEYDDCVQQCVAKYGKAPVEYKPSATQTAGSSGTGATHTVVVAPTQGVLRYIPFAINATVGDTIKFMWGANNHTVTKSSALLPCNKTGDALFASGVQNKDFVFTQVVNTTEPTYFHCATPGHCQKGMFGIINPTTNFAAATTFSSKIQSIAQNNTVIDAYAAYTRKMTEGNKAAAGWGGNIDLAAMPDWAAPLVAENVLFTRNFLAANPETMKEDGTIDLSSASSTPLAVPQDITALAATAETGATSATSAATGSTPEATPGAGSTNAGTSPEALNNSAASGNAPRFLVAAMAVLASLFLL